MIKVLHVSTPSSWRGGEQQAYNLVKFQHESDDVKPFVLTPQKSELSQKLTEAGIQQFNFSSAGIFRLKIAKEIARLCRQQKFDLVHTHDSHGHTAAVLSAAIFGNKTPLIIHRRVDFAVTPNIASRWKYNYHSVKRIICVSEMIRKITEPAIRNPDKLRVIYSGVDPSRYANSTTGNVIRQEYKISESALLIGNLSALADHKDYPTFLRTARILKDRGDINARFIIAGDGSEKSKIEQQIKDLSLEDDIILTGFRKDIPAVMQSLDIFLMTSKTEGLGTILIEAFMAGVPVVSTDAGGIPELVMNEITGLVSRPGDAENLAASVTRIAKDPHLRKTLVERARNFAKNFTYSSTALKTLEVYREVLQEHEPTSAS